MNWNAVLTLFSVAIWPMTVLAISILFRRELKRALGRMDQVRYGGFEASFERQLRQAEVDLRVDSPAGSKAIPPSKVLKESDRGADSQRLTAAEREALYRLAILNPRAAVGDAWKRLEKTIRESARAGDFTRQRHLLPWNELTLALQELGHLPEPVFARLNRLRSLYATTDAPADAGRLTADQARRYLDMALPLITTIETARAGRATGPLAPGAQVQIPS
jgi:hypothetical protein